MNAEFNWWLLIVGLVVGAGLVWLVIADWSRREEDISEDELAAESAWIAQTLHERGEDLDPAAAEEVLALHRAYLRQTGALETVADIADEPSYDELAEANADADLEAPWPTEPHAGPADDEAPTSRATERADTARREGADTARRVGADMGRRNPSDRSDADPRDHLDEPDVEPRDRQQPTDVDPRDRRSVRSTPLSPRGGPDPEFDPPA
jgi:hypothetical protein